MPKSLLKLVQTQRIKPEWTVSGWHDTPQRKLARERNWCYYILAGMEALAGVIIRFGCPTHGENIRRAVRSARFGVDHVYYARMEKLNKARK